jgi:carboxyl-terminal processing protease
MVFLICRAVRLSPSARHVLWLLVLCRLLAPPVATWPWSISIDDAHDTAHVEPTRADVVASDAIESGRTSSSPVVSVLDAVRALGEAVDGSGREVVETQSAPAGNVDFATVVASDAVGQNDAASRMPMAWLITGLWGVGSMMVSVVLVFRVRRVRHLLKNDTGVDTWLQDDIADLSDRLKVRAPDCVVTSAIRSPFLWCLGRVRLVWPRSISRSEQRQEVRPVLVHELAHLKRRDHWTAWIELLALIVWWWNPVFWFVRRQLRASAEMACDAWVVELLPDQRRAYAELLVEFGRRRRTSQLAFGAVGVNTGSRRMFERRLEMIMNEDSVTRLSKWPAFFAVLLGVFSLPTFAIEPTTPPQDAVAQPEASAPDNRALAELVAQFNKLIDDGRFAEAAIVARKAEELDPEDPVTVAMVAKSRRAARQEQRASESDSSDASPDQATTTKQRVVESKKRRVVESTLDDTASASVSASLNEVLSRIERQYYGRLDRRELERAAIKAIMSKLDDKSSLMTREEYEQMTVLVAGNLVGVGIAIHLDSETNLPVVTRPVRNSPGLAAGLRRDDVILGIDGDSTKGLSLKELVDRIRGPRGSTVRLGIQRADEKLEVKVVRERFETSVVNPWSIAANGRENYWADHDRRIGYVHIPSFTKHTVSQLQKVLADLSDEGLKGLVLDLRDCGGGLLTAATEVVDMFIDEGIILSSQGRSEDENITFRAKEGGAYVDLPLAVLMNGYTASAAEIVAASLQDHHRAAMVGEQTFGRGTVQSIFRLQDGGALKLTTAAWLRPNGRTLLRREGRDDWGVQPDVGLAVVLTEEVHKQLAEQRETRLNRERVETPVDDPQLKKAVAFLHVD